MSACDRKPQTIRREVEPEDALGLEVSQLLRRASVNGLQPDYAQIELQDYSGNGSSVPSEALLAKPLNLTAFPVKFMFM